MDLLGALGNIASNYNRDDMTRGLSDAFRSDQTPPFPQMLGSLFGNSNSNVKASVINQLMAGVGPAVGRATH